MGQNVMMYSFKGMEMQSLYGDPRIRASRVRFHTTTTAVCFLL